MGQFICDDLLNYIFQYTDNFNITLVCKQWYNIVLKNSVICDSCNKIVKMYDKDLWITDTYDDVCHGYYGTLKSYRILKQTLMKKYMSMHTKNAIVLNRIA
jgi:hypothetical protein